MELDVRKNPALAAIVAAAALPLFYAGVMWAFGSSQFILLNLREIWPYLALMSIGLGAQAGMLVHIHNAARLGTGAMAASGGVSAGAMAACCAHHATDLLPLVGLSALAGIADKYQHVFLLLGAFSNALGIVWMLGHIRKHGLLDAKSAWAAFAKPDWNAAFPAIAVILGAVWAAFALRAALG